VRPEWLRHMRPLSRRHPTVRPSACALALWAILCGLLFACSAAAQAPALEAEVQLGFDGHFRVGAWTPVRVVLHNRGEALTGEIALNVAAGPPIDGSPEELSYRRPLQLAANSVHTYAFTVPMRQTFEPLHLLVTDALGHTLFTHDVELHDAAVHSDLVLVLDERSGGYNFLSRTVPGRLDLAYAPTPDALPSDWLAYTGLAGIIVGDFAATRLEPAQVGAIREWVAFGGRLLFVGGPQLDVARSDLFTLLSPVAYAGGQRAVLVSDLGSAYGAFAKPVTLLTWKSRLSAGTSGDTLAGDPLTASRWYGEGRVGYIGFDVTDPQLSDWIGLGAFTAEPFNLLDNTGASLVGEAPVGDHAIWPMIRNHPVPTLGNWPVVPLVIAYFLVFGATALWARSQPRRWGLALAASGALSAALGLVLPRIDRADRAVVAFSITQIARNVHEGHLTVYAGLAQRTAADWRLADAAEAVAKPLSRGLDNDDPLIIQQGPNAYAIRSGRPVPWVPVVVDRSVRYPVDATVTTHTDGTTVAIENELPVALRDLVYIEPTRAVPLGRVDPHSHRTFDLPLQQSWWSRNNGSDWLAAEAIDALSRLGRHLDPYELTAMRQLIMSVLGDRPGAQSTPWGLPLLVGATDGTELPALFTGGHSQQGIHLFILPLVEAEAHPLPASFTLDLLKATLGSGAGTPSGTEANGP
ncbi:MAG TPA: hypothetical protein VFK80_04940, partial [Limnochordia bacterium]|nr:hypothetical protein [Limnochordia bacterium]